MKRVIFFLAVTLFMSMSSVASANLLWGPAGTDPSLGVLDATLAPYKQSGVYTYTNVGNEGYDVVLTLNNLNGNGFYNDNHGTEGIVGWWFEGAVPHHGYSDISFRFFDTGTNDPYAIDDINFLLQDAEHGERIANFVYWDSQGNPIETSFDDATIFSYSHDPVYDINIFGDPRVYNTAPVVGTTQAGKTIGIDLSGIPISGFSFRPSRRGDYAGSVIMTPVNPGSNPVPEPATMVLMGTGLAGLALRKRFAA